LLADFYHVWRKVVTICGSALVISCAERSPLRASFPKRLKQIPHRKQCETKDNAEIDPIVFHLAAIKGIDAHKMRHDGGGTIYNGVRWEGRALDSRCRFRRWSRESA
jgi:hypothetical protein